MTKDRMISTLRALFPGDDNGIAKSEVLYDLASEVSQGCIVEAGAGRGVGSIALAYGTVYAYDVPLYCVDPFEPVRGWANEDYNADTRAQWYENVANCGIPHIPRLISLPIDAIIVWPYEVSLTFWDLGLRMRDCTQELFGWLSSTAVQAGSIVAINETGGNDLGVDDWIAEYKKLEIIDVRHRIRITRRL